MATALKSLVEELIGRKNRSRKHMSKSHIAPEAEGFLSPPMDADEDHHRRPWASLPPDLLLEIVKRVEATDPSWPARRDLVVCAAVCRSWREVVHEVVQPPEQCGLLTFPISLKQPGPREHPIQCFIRRERSSSTYLLYLGLSPGGSCLPNAISLSGEDSKLLMAAKKIRRPMCMDFVISLVADDFSRSSSNFVGKLRSNFLGTKFTVFDSQPPMDLPTQSRKRGSSRSCSRNYPSASVLYELNVLRTRGPRRMHCTMDSIPLASILEGGTAPTPTTFAKPVEVSLPLSGWKSPIVGYSTQSSPAPSKPIDGSRKEALVLKNKAPRWHEQLQCWCLNFKGRVTVASVKNFQLVAAVDPAHDVSVVEQEKVILQFGKIGKDMFTMDYRYPLSAFQAFAICLSSFDTKPACE